MCEHWTLQYLHKHNVEKVLNDEKSNEEIIINNRAGKQANNNNNNNKSNMYTGIPHAHIHTHKAQDQFFLRLY